jgi:hypothetical protein
VPSTELRSKFPDPKDEIGETILPFRFLRRDPGAKKLLRGGRREEVGNLRRAGSLEGTAQGALLLREKPSGPFPIGIVLRGETEREQTL